MVLEHIFSLRSQQIKSEVNISGFIESIIYSVVQTKEQESDYISKFTYFLKSLKGYSVNTIENYILKEDKSIVTIIKKQGAGHIGFMPGKV